MSERAWVSREWPLRSAVKQPHKHSRPFLSFVRYMRWYCTDSRSYLLRKIDPPAPIDNSRHYPRWPRRVV